MDDAPSLRRTDESRNRDDRHPQGVPRHSRQRRHHTAGRGRPDPRDPRRERSRQEHAHEHPLRTVQGRQGCHKGKREGGFHLQPERCLRPGHRHGAPAFPAGPQLHGCREHNTRTRRRLRIRHKDRQQEDKGDFGPIWSFHRPRHGHRGHHGRHAAACGDSQDALPRCGHTHIRRAHRRPDASGDRRVDADHAQPRRGGQVDHPDHPQARGDQGRRGEVHDHPPWKAHRRCGRRRHLGGGDGGPHGGTPRELQGRQGRAQDRRGRPGDQEPSWSRPSAA